MLVQSQILSRRWVGCDTGPKAIATSRKLFETNFGPKANLLKILDDASVANHAPVCNDYKSIFLDIPELDNARQRLASLIAVAASLKKEMSGTPQGDEDVLAVLFEILPRLKWLVGETARTEAATALGLRLPSFRRLEADSLDFLVTGFVILQMLPDGMDASVVSVSVWKAIENELNCKLLVPFRDWIVGTHDDIASFVAGDSGADPRDWERRELAKYLKKSKLPPLGTTRGILDKCANSKKTIQNSSSLMAFREYIQTHFADPSFLLLSQGILSVLSQEKIDRYRNGAAHTTAFTKERASESLDFGIQALAAMLEGFRSAASK